MKIPMTIERRRSVERFGRKSQAVIIATAVALAVITGGCSKKDFNKEVVASVNGEEITVLEMREYLGAPAGIFAFTEMPADQKRKSVDQLVAGRLVVQAGRNMGMDDTQEYKETLKRNDLGVRVDALIRKEAGEKLKLDDKEVQAEVEKIRKENGGISEADAKAQASKTIVGLQLRKIQKELLATAKKETGASIDNAVLDRMGKGEKLSDNAVLASAGDEKILYGDVKKIISEMPMLPIRQGQQDAEVTRALVTRVLEQELVLRALKAYSTKQGVEGSEGYKMSQRNMERAVIANMLFDNVAGTSPEVSDEEIQADYARRVQMMEGDKAKAPPVSAVKEQLREILKNQKRRVVFENYIEDLRKKGKVTVNEDVLPKV